MKYSELSDQTLALIKEIIEKYAETQDDICSRLDHHKGSPEALLKLLADKVSDVQLINDALESIKKDKESLLV